jgi:hypothetical protein
MRTENKRQRIYQPSSINTYTYRRKGNREKRSVVHIRSLCSMMIHSDGRYNKNCFFFLSLSISLIPTNKNAPSFFIIIQHHTATKQEEVPLYTQQFSSGSKIDFCLISFVWLYGLSCVFVPHRKRDHRSSSHVCVCVCVCVHMASDGQPKNCIWLCESAREVRRRRRLMASPQLFMH